MDFPVEILLKNRNVSTTETVTIGHGQPATWGDAEVRDVLVEILRAIDRAQNPGAPTDRRVVLQGFSWIVEPSGERQVVIAIEIPMGAAVAGPFAIGQAELDAIVARVIRAERQATAPSTVH